MESESGQNIEEQPKGIFHPDDAGIIRCKGCSRTKEDVISYSHSRKCYFRGVIVKDDNI